MHHDLILNNQMFKYGQNKTTKYTHVVFMLIFTLRYSQTYYGRSHINPLKQPYLHFFTYTLWACLFFLQLHIRYFRLKHEVSISSTLNVQIFRTNVVLAAFTTYM